jgi:large subunit ribosomal protein L6
MKAALTELLPIADGVTVTYENKIVVVKGPKGEVSRNFYNPNISITTEGSNLKLFCPKGTKRENRLIFTMKSHLTNMMKGVQEPWSYGLKICSSHFPMNAKVDGNTFMVKNFLGEKTPRKFTFPDAVKVKIAGTDVTVESIDLEKAGNVAGRIELITAIRGRDQRIFQDGIYIVRKAKSR